MQFKKRKKFRKREENSWDKTELDMRKNMGFNLGYACEMRLVSSKVERNSKLSTARVQNKPTSYEHFTSFCFSL